MKKELSGWLWVNYDDTALYETKEKMEYDNPYSVDKLHERLEEFHGKQVKITIEVIE